MTKVSKSSVNYSPGMKLRHCGICRFREPPDDCEKVSSAGEPTPGRIDAEYWCKLFETKR